MKLVAKTNRTKIRGEDATVAGSENQSKDQNNQKNKAWRSDVNRIDLALVPKYKQTIIVSVD